MIKKEQKIKPNLIIVKDDHKNLYNKKPFVKQNRNISQENLNQTIYQVNHDKKLQVLINILKGKTDSTICFCNSKSTADLLMSKFRENNIKAKVLYEGLTPAQMGKFLFEFKNERFNVLIATDTSSKEMKLNEAVNAVNYELPKDTNIYEQRASRISKALKKGEVISFITGNEDRKFLQQVVLKYTGTIILKKGDQAVRPVINKPVNQNRPIKKNQEKQYPFEVDSSYAKSSDYYNRNGNKNNRGKNYMRKSKPRPWSNY